MARVRAGSCDRDSALMPQNVTVNTFTTTPSHTWDKLAFSEYPKRGNQGIAMRTDRYRYVEWRNKKGELVARELYDHQIDPQENENVAGQAAQAGTLEQLARQLGAKRPPASVKRVGPNG
jgi:hypothetical protein